MKKNYIIPALRYVEMDSKDMMAAPLVGSIRFMNNERSSAQITISEDTPLENTSFDARSQNAWDDEW